MTSVQADLLHEYQRSVSGARFSLQVLRAVAKGVVLDSVRRKEIYVVLVLGVVMAAAAASIDFFGVSGLARFSTDVTLTATNFFTVIIAVVISARQFPEELAHRTLHPLLARPVSRLQILLGKFAGAGIISVGTFLAFALMAAMVLAVFKTGVEPIFFQYVYLRCLLLLFVCALTISLSFYLTHSANVVICLLLALFGATAAQAAVLAHPRVSEFWARLIEVAYWVVPHLDLFDISKKVVHGWDAIPFWVMGALTVYAALYSTLALFFGLRKFERTAL